MKRYKFLVIFVILLCCLISCGKKVTAEEKRIENVIAYILDVEGNEMYDINIEKLDKIEENWKSITYFYYVQIIHKNFYKELGIYSYTEYNDGTFEITYEHEYH